MNRFQKEKIENAVAYFAQEFKDIRGYYPRQTWIYKLLALLDSFTCKKSGIPCLGLEYEAMERGPVPIAMYQNREYLTNHSDKFRFVPAENGGYVVEALEEPDLDVFSERELDEIDAIVQKCVSSGFFLEDLIHYAHKEIRPWQKAWSQAQKLGKRKMPMRYSDTFENPHLLSADEEELSPEELHFRDYLKLTTLAEVVPDFP